MQFGGAAKRLTRACGRALAGVVDEHDGALEAALEVAQEAEDVRPHPFGCALKRFGVATLDQAGRDLVGKRSGGCLPAPGFLVAPAPLGGPCERWRPSGERVQPWSRSACRTHLRYVSLVKPIFSAIDPIAAHCESCAEWCSSTMRTARSRTSGEYLFEELMVCCKDASRFARSGVGVTGKADCSVVSGLLMRSSCPLALMESADPRLISSSGLLAPGAIQAWRIVV